MTILAFFILSVATVYLGLILLFTLGWYYLEIRRYGSTGYSTKVSVIIPARNEENTIGNCLEDISHQDFPKDLMEVIVVDDSSTDGTYGSIEAFIRDHPGLKLHLLKNGSGAVSAAFKKQAIETGILKATGDLIITTDADTRSGPGWISSIVSYYEKRKPKMILGPVGFLNDTGFFRGFQSAEFAGLMGTTGGACNIGLPLMCNGANLAYEREAFVMTGGYKNDRSIISGDDLFLMMRIRKMYGNRAIHFLKEEKAIVWTEPKNNLRDFVQQRLRWVSKNKDYQDAWVLFTAFMTYLVNLSLLAGLVAAFFSPLFRIIFTVIFLAKVILEFPLVYAAASFFGKTKTLVYFPLFQAVNIFYVTLVGFFGNFISFNWKGRKSN
jgi:cellulose synthase/poly-beta-1,6-N-acetylglucosamine synthase-like glycosyltransferase